VAEFLERYPAITSLLRRRVRRGIGTRACRPAASMGHRFFGIRQSSRRQPRPIRCTGNNSSRWCDADAHRPAIPALRLQWRNSPHMARAGNELPHLQRRRAQNARPTPVSRCIWRSDNRRNSVPFTLFAACAGSAERTHPSRRKRRNKSLQRIHARISSLKPVPTSRPPSVATVTPRCTIVVVTPRAVYGVLLRVRLECRKLRSGNVCGFSSQLILLGERCLPMSSLHA
jgi:hypothetical protein